MTGLVQGAFSSLAVLPADTPEYQAANFNEETWWLTLIKAVFIVVFLILSVVMALWVERRGLGRIQTRPGPNVAGPLGLFQALADAGKLLFKEDIWTSRADKFLYFLAPVVMAFSAFSVMAVIPLGPNVNLFGHSSPLQLIDMPVSSLYILAVTSLSVYGVVLGGWSARSTLPLYGALRSAAQVISYELAMGMSLVSVFLISRTMSTSEIVAAQSTTWWCFALLPSFIVYFISMFGEINRLPFDLPEAEGELVAGHMTEYSSMKFGWYYLAEYINMVNVSAVATTMFLGGWHAPWPFSHVDWLNGGWMGLVWFVIKLWVVMCVIILVRGTLLRVRYDQFMDLGWKILIPVALVWIVLVALMQGVQLWLPGYTFTMLAVVVALILVIAIVVYFMGAPKVEEEEEPESFDGFADGYPVPPLPGQTLPPSPRAQHQAYAATPALVGAPAGDGIADSEATDSAATATGSASKETRSE